MFCRVTFVGVCLVLALQAPVQADGGIVEIAITGGKEDLKNVPVAVPLDLKNNATSSDVRDEAGKQLASQLTSPGLLSTQAAPSPGAFAKELHVLIPSLKAGETIRLRAKLGMSAPASGQGFAWKTNDDETTDLRLENHPVLRYMHAKYDESTPAKRDLTYKVFHHLFDPTGQRLVTKGAGGLYPHHRGIYFGFNKISYGEGKKADTWHCTKGAHQSNDKIVSVEAGNLLGRHLVEIGWHGEDKDVFAKEQRELTVYRVQGGTMVDFAARLKTTGGTIKLDGDPQHAGVQFRADNEVAAKTSKETIYIRPDGVGQAGVEWNWPAQKSQVNLPWKAMSFVLDGKRYTVANCDRPENPKESRFSERTYGRFGSYFVYDLTSEKPLEVRYRFWLQDGQMTQQEVATLAAGFAEKLKVVVK